MANGLPVDAGGRPAVDPTKNVNDTIEAAVKRIDDLRDVTVRRMDDLRAASEELATERCKHAEFVAKLRAAHDKEVRTQNNERLAALRQVDISTRNEDRKTADDAIRQLANQTESLRQTLSKQVTDTAETLSKAKIESDKATELRISALERSSYIGAGERAVSDPAMAGLAASVAELVKANQATAGERRATDPAMVMLTETVAKLATAQSTSAGSWGGANRLWVIIAGVISLWLALSGRINLITPASAPAVQPQASPVTVTQPARIVP